MRFWVFWAILVLAAVSTEVSGLIKHDWALVTSGIGLAYVSLVSLVGFVIYSGSRDPGKEGRPQ